MKDTRRMGRGLELACGLAILIGCKTPPGPAPAPAAIAPVADAASNREAAGAVVRPPPADRGDIRLPNGEPWRGAERVEADVIRVTTLTAISVSANEIRCPRVTR